MQKQRHFEDSFLEINPERYLATLHQPDTSSSPWLPGPTLSEPRFLLILLAIETGPDRTSDACT